MEGCWEVATSSLGRENTAVADAHAARLDMSNRATHLSDAPDPPRVNAEGTMPPGKPRAADPWLTERVNGMGGGTVMGTAPDAPTVAVVLRGGDADIGDDPLVALLPATDVAVVAATAPDPLPGIPGVGVLATAEVVASAAAPLAVPEPALCTKARKSSRPAPEPPRLVRFGRSTTALIGVRTHSVSRGSETWPHQLRARLTHVSTCARTGSWGRRAHGAGAEVRLLCRVCATVAVSPACAPLRLSAELDTRAESRRPQPVREGAQTVVAQHTKATTVTPRFSLASGQATRAQGGRPRAPRDQTVTRACHQPT